MRVNNKGNVVLRGLTREQDTSNDQTKKINVNDFAYNSGFRLVDFRISSENKTASGETMGVVALSKDAVVSADAWDWSNQQQIGWASSDSQSTSIERDLFSVVDSSVVIVDEIYVFVHHAASAASKVNYYMELEPVDLKAYEYAMNYIQNKSQG